LRIDIEEALVDQQFLVREVRQCRSALQHAPQQETFGLLAVTGQRRQRIGVARKPGEHRRAVVDGSDLRLAGRAIAPGGPVQSVGQEHLIERHES